MTVLQLLSRRALVALFAAAGFLCADTAPHAQDSNDLRVGIKADPTIDPHFLYLATNIAIARHIFEPLIYPDAASKLQPRLATSWRTIDPTTWEFKLRQGVKFHDGSPFEPEDVLFSFDRVRTLPNNPNPYTSSLRTFKEVKVVDRETIHIVTDVPNVEVPTQVRNIAIVSRKAAADARPADFASGRAAIGTGPFTFVRFAPNDRLILKRFPGYWGEPAKFEDVTFRMMTNDASRVAALLAGDVDVIDFVPPADIPRLERTGAVKIFTAQSDRTIYLALNTVPERLEWATDASGAALAPNPFKDPRVREAISKAIDRKALVARGLEGSGVATSQFVPPGFGGFDPALPAETADPAAARKLLAEAGFPSGLTAKMLCPNGRYVNDAAVCQLVGAMLSRVGIKTNLEALPPTVFFSKVTAPNPQAAIVLLGWGLGSDSAMTVLQSALRTYDAARGTGANNRGSSDPEVDRLSQLATETFDEGKRFEIMRQALGVARTNAIAVPLYSEQTVLAARQGLVVTPRADQQTIVNDVAPPAR